jgi:hypothetical protein
MIPKSGARFSEQIMSNKNIDAQTDLAKPDQP